jgi:hypothetical protein
MTSRHGIVINLVKEVLGPRSGAREVLPQDQDPRDEFITGILAPVPPENQKEEIEADVDEFSQEEEKPGEEDEDNPSTIVVPRVVSPALNPKSQPSSFGLSFCLEASLEQPVIEICVTWSRYLVDPAGFRRDPRQFLSGPIKIATERRWMAEPDLVLRMQCRQQANASWRVSLFLVNTQRATAGVRPSVDQFVFQPQIRVHCLEGATVVPVHRGDCSLESTDATHIREDASLSMLYSARRPLARGHMCGATWKEIDPERPCANVTVPQDQPFTWVDSCIVPPQEVNKFSPADVRTDFVPMYPVEAPDMEWNQKYGPPECDPEKLSELWDPVQIKAALDPLVSGYKNWLNDQSKLKDNIAEVEQRQLADDNIKASSEVADRLNEAIVLLCGDDNVRLAFCFANKAIAKQAAWHPHRTTPLKWRPFQLAFILLNIPSLANPLHQDRNLCDLLWFPTGGGKTEAYLGLTAFTLALRRRRALMQNAPEPTGAGTGVLSRYTLRLLTIQQFRRALGVITACEMLRVEGLQIQGAPVGWRPAACRLTDSFLWGNMRFSVGLWAGQDVTPNSLLGRRFVAPNNRQVYLAGAIELLQGATDNYRGPNQRLARKLRFVHDFEGKGEPAQVLHCPRCRSILAIPDSGLPRGDHTLHFVFQASSVVQSPLPLIQLPRNCAALNSVLIRPDRLMQGYYTASINLSLTDALEAIHLDNWWYTNVAPVIGTAVELMAARPARPGYFIHCYFNQQGNPDECDFDLYCPDPECELNNLEWAEQWPLSRDYVSSGSTAGPVSRNYGPLPLKSGFDWQVCFPAFQRANTIDGTRISLRTPIPAYTVDDQIYHKCPSLVIATVDKFARLAFEPKAGAMFGNVEFFHSRWGYYREGCPPSAPGNLPTGFVAHPPPLGLRTTSVPFNRPDLILQDELHLIEGPLGSMVGLYETAIDSLCSSANGDGAILPKYIASTATVRQAEPQVQSLFARGLRQFPPFALTADDRFFSKENESHPLQASKPGRLYIAICAPGKGAQTPVVRIWSSLLQTAYQLWQASRNQQTDSFFTLVGYFNAIRELAKAQSLLTQDIPERMTFSFGTARRPLDRMLELSSRKDSMELPALLESLTVSAPGAHDAVLATSMFGTGVDVDRLSLMVVHGQPKNSASYIQATGRVGRQGGGLVVTFFRASRPRDLDHYEFFTGYHRALYRHVEPITVAPFSPRTRERALGPIAVALLRQARAITGAPVNREWRVQQRLAGQTYFANAFRMGVAPNRRSGEVTSISDLMEQRALTQPPGRRPLPNVTRQEMANWLDHWQNIAAQHQNHDGFVYSEPATTTLPTRAVVLGDAQHTAQNLDQVYENAPQSMRDVEDTTGFKT